MTTPLQAGGPAEKAPVVEPAIGPSTPDILGSFKKSSGFRPVPSTLEPVIVGRATGFPVPAPLFPVNFLSSEHDTSAAVIATIKIFMF